MLLDLLRNECLHWVVLATPVEGHTVGTGALERPLPGVLHLLWVQRGGVGKVLDETGAEEAEAESALQRLRNAAGLVADLGESIVERLGVLHGQRTRHGLEREHWEGEGGRVSVVFIVPPPGLFTGMCGIANHDCLALGPPRQWRLLAELPEPTSLDAANHAPQRLAQPCTGGLQVGH